MTQTHFSPHVLLQSPEEVFMEIRRPLEWHCKQMDHFVGLNFSANFNFALVGHLLKGTTSAESDIVNMHIAHFICSILGGVSL